ncbi:MAG: sugar phosphate isomerase/epimerase family protein [Bacteroidota bacterium]
MQAFNHTRRKSLKSLAGLPLLGLATSTTVASVANLAKADTAQKAFTYCLNTSTIMGQKIGIVQEMETAAKAGFDGIEIWIPTLQQYLSEGGRLSDLKQRAADLNLRIENAIGFAPWIVDDNDLRSAALEQAKREMHMLAEIGCPRIAAPPAGATNQGGLDLHRAAERFRALVELGAAAGCMPQLELWGFSKNLSRLSEVLTVAAECGHPKVRILPDVYHLYKGGSDFDGLQLLHPKVVEIFHINDYPATPDRGEITDKDRVLPGDGIAPLDAILKQLGHPMHPTILSLELFNRELWAKDPLEVAKVGLAKMKAAVASAGF